MLPTKDSGTRNIYRLAFRRFEKAVSPGYVDAIRIATIDKYVRVRLAEKKMPSPATINKELRHLKAAFKKAFSWEMLPKTPEVVMLRELQRDPYTLLTTTLSRRCTARATLLAVLPSETTQSRTGGKPCSASPT